MVIDIIAQNDAQPLVSFYNVQGLLRRMAISFTSESPVMHRRAARREEVKRATTEVWCRCPPMFPASDRESFCQKENATLSLGPSIVLALVVSVRPSGASGA